MEDIKTYFTVDNKGYFGDKIARISPKKFNDLAVKDVTFQVTNDCCCNCSYCYQINKGHSFMSKETGKQIVDLLFKMYDEDNPEMVINKSTQGVILDFIGGEPLMAVDVIDYICSYFLEKCVDLDHPWAKYWMISISSNGALYFDEKVQKFLKKFENFISLNITIDGPKEIHDACRKYYNGEGNFDDALAAYLHYNEHYYNKSGTKVTIARENLKDLNTIIDFFLAQGETTINANCVYEVEWNYEDAKIFYDELKKMADKLLKLDIQPMVALFRENSFRPMSPENNDNWCGGNGRMLAFNPDGVAYPCLRFMESSLGDSQEPLVIGSAAGLLVTDKDKENIGKLKGITRRSQSTDECFNCPIAEGCAWCTAWNYQETGSPNKRSTHICAMHKARSLANAYYWNNLYRKHGISKRFKIHLPKEECLKIIDKVEYEKLLNLSKEE